MFVGYFKQMRKSVLCKVFILLDKQRRKTQALVSLYAWSCKADVYESFTQWRQKA